MMWAVMCTMLRKTSGMYHVSAVCCNCRIKFSNSRIENSLNYYNLRPACFSFYYLINLLQVTILYYPYDHQLMVILDIITDARKIRRSRSTCSGQYAVLIPVDLVRVEGYLSIQAYLCVASQYQLSTVSVHVAWRCLIFHIRMRFLDIYISKLSDVQVKFYCTRIQIYGKQNTCCSVYSHCLKLSCCCSGSCG